MRHIDVYSNEWSPVMTTDLYQLTMAQAYWKAGMQDHEAVFHAFFRKLPFAGGYAVACGVGSFVEMLEHFHFHGDSRHYLNSLKGSDGRPLFQREFINWLIEDLLTLHLRIDAIPEGSVVFPHEPLVRVTGPIIQAQLVETLLLNQINFQTLIATKASRIRDMVGPEDTLLEFGLRRAQGIDGGLSASRAAYIGGCDATSNVLAGQVFGIPVKGTHAHSWVMAHDDELEAFRAYAEACPNNCMLLVDTYDTIEGIKKAIQVGRELKAKGYPFGGVRLDSGDLAELSKVAEELLLEAGFAEAKIVASNDLDEYTIQSLKQQGARIDVWGVGTKLATAYDQPALGGVYKLAAIHAPGEKWKHKIKLSEQPIKTSNPGPLTAIRAYDWQGYMCGDCIAPVDFEYTRTPWPLEVDSLEGMPALTYGIHNTRKLLQSFMKNGETEVLTANETIDKARARRGQQVFDELKLAYRRLLNPHYYPLYIDTALTYEKLELRRKMLSKE